MRIEVAAGIIRRAEKILIARRPEGIHLGGYWEFPGGKRKRNESWTECLHRELHEELGVSVEVGRLLFETEHAYPEKVVALRFYECSIRSGVPRALEVAEVLWVRREDLTRYSFPPADEPLLSILQSP